ncbi:MAG: sigma-54 dependent transcriptional regulator [Myxococcota bacterium]
MCADIDPRKRLLIIDDEHELLRALDRSLAARYAVLTADSGGGGLRLAQTADPAAVILDMHMPDMHGLDVLMRLKESAPTRPVMMMTGRGDVDLVVRAMKSGADDYVLKPADLEHLDAKLSELFALRGEHVPCHVKVAARWPLLDAATAHAVEVMARHSDTTVLLEGPTGSGKGVVAELIHQRSRRASGPFVDINCAGLSEELLDSELFGHERGAFTDATQQKPGLMELADGGTLFLDEIGDMPLAIQAKVLKAIESKQLRRLGGTRTLKVDARIVAATNAQLTELVRAGRFRQDLYYRLCVMPIGLPPLRDRLADIEPLAVRFVAELAGRSGKQVIGISDEAMLRLRAHDWPGNIRELRNVIERACILATTSQITTSELPSLVGVPRSPTTATSREEMPSTLDEAERRHILRTLAYTADNKAAAARLLDVNISTLSRKLARYGR